MGTGVPLHQYFAEIALKISSHQPEPVANARSKDALLIHLQVLP
jgi:hypothetical protein